jgi:hypothetical protein
VCIMYVLIRSFVYAFYARACKDFAYMYIQCKQKTLLRVCCYNIAVIMSISAVSMSRLIMRDVICSCDSIVCDCLCMRAMSLYAKLAESTMQSNFLPVDMIISGLIYLHIVARGVFLLIGSLIIMPIASGSRVYLQICGMLIIGKRAESN